MRLIDADALKIGMSNAGGWSGACHIAQDVIDEATTIECATCRCAPRNGGECDGADVCDGCTEYEQVKT